MRGGPLLLRDLQGRQCCQPSVRPGILRKSQTGAARHAEDAEQSLGPRVLRPLCLFRRPAVPVHYLHRSSCRLLAALQPRLTSCVPDAAAAATSMITSSDKYHTNVCRVASMMLNWMMESPPLSAQPLRSRVNCGTPASRLFRHQPMTRTQHPRLSLTPTPALSCCAASMPTCRALGSSL